jgi:hypothetical protein
MSDCKHLKYDGEGYCWECGLHYLDIIPVMQERIEKLESVLEQSFEGAKFALQEKDRRISLLEKVAEAAANLLPFYVCCTVKEVTLEEALRAAGYLTHNQTCSAPSTMTKARRE